MNTTSFTFAGIGLLLSASLLTADMPSNASYENQTVYVNLSQIMQESVAGKEANIQLEKIRSTKADDINRKVKALETAKADLQKATNEFEAKKNLLKDLKSEEKKLTDLNRKVVKCEAELKECAEDAEKDFRAEYMRISEQLFKDQIESISQWAREKKVVAVVDAESGRVLYRRDGVDVTQHMLTVVNKNHEQKTAVAQAKTAAPASTTVAQAKPAVKSA